MPLLKRFLDKVKAAGGDLHVSIDVDFLDPTIARVSARRFRAVRRSRGASDHGNRDPTAGSSPVSISSN